MPFMVNEPAIIIETCSPVTACVIWLHGLGADGNDFSGIVEQLQLPQHTGIRFIFPHAPVRPVTLNNGFAMRAWYDIYSLGESFREDRAGIETSEQAIRLLIQQQQEAGIPSTRIIVAGFSQGGAMALHTGLRFPQPLAGIMGLSTYLPLYKHLADESRPENKHTPIFLAHGELDQVILVQFAQKTCQYIMQLGYKVEWNAYPIGHQVCLPEITDISRWLQTVLNFPT